MVHRWGNEVRWILAADNLCRDGNGRHLGMRKGGLGELEKLNLVSGVYMFDCKIQNLPGSADGAIPGTIFEGEKAACSMSAKKFVGYV